MPARDIYHSVVVQALQADGWTITHDPLYLAYGGRELYIDLGAERDAIAAEKKGQKIAVEIKSFLSPSPIHDLQEAVGQYDIYRSVLSELEANRLLYLAVPKRVYDSLFTEKFGQLILTRIQIRLIVFDEQPGRIIQWIN
jgi:XisH protein